MRSRIPGKGWGGRTPLYRPGRRNHRNTGQSLGTLSRQRGGVSDCAHRHAVLRIRCWLCPELPVQPAVAVFQGTAPCPAAVGECENRLQMLCCGSGWQEEPVAPAACSGQGVTECYWHPPVELLLLLLVPETGRFAPRAPACSGLGRSRCFQGSAASWVGTWGLPAHSLVRNCSQVNFSQPLCIQSAVVSLGCFAGWRDIVKSWSLKWLEKVTPRWRVRPGVWSGRTQAKRRRRRSMMRCACRAK